jgi:hypothetical protein
MLRHIMYREVTESSEELVDVGSSGSFLADNLPARPFAVIRLGVTSPGMAHIKRGTAEIWIHDDPGSYDRIDAILKSVYDRLNGAEHLTDEAGNELMSSTWRGTSGDLNDPGFRTITKNISFEIVGKEA